MKKLALLSMFLPVISGCTSLPDGITPVSNFELKRYLGTWYEIARFDHRFERGLSNVTAEYSLRDDGGVKVLNRGYSNAAKKWKEAEGKAYFEQNTSTGFLKVSFFGPFYASYVIFELDHENYQYSLICGSDRSYLWILARTPVIDDQLKEKLVRIAREKGFDTDKLIFVEQ